MSKVIKEVLSTTQEIKIGEKSYKITPVTLGDMSSFQSWCDVQKKKEIIEVYKLAGKEIDVKEVMSISGDQEYYDTTMNSLDGIVYLLHQNIMKNNNIDITYMTMDQLSDDLKTDDFEEIVQVLFGNFLDDKDDGGKVKNQKAKSQLKK